MRAIFLSLLIWLITLDASAFMVVLASDDSTAPDTTDPELSSATANGTDRTLVFTEAVTANTTGELCSDWALTWTTAGADSSWTYTSGDGTNTVHCAGAAVGYGDTVSAGLDYTPGTIVDLAGTPNALAAITSAAVIVPAVDWSNPITDGLIGAYKLDEGSGNPVNYVTMVSSSLVGVSVPTYSAGGMTFTDQGNILSDLSGILSSSTSYTIVSSVVNDSKTDSVARYWLTFGKTTSAASPAVGFGWYSTDPNRAYVSINGTNILYSAGYTISTAADLTYAVTFIKEGAIELFINGSSFWSGTSALVPDSNGALSIGGHWRQDASTAYSSQNGLIRYVLVFDRILSAAEIASLYADPTQVYN